MFTNLGFSFATHYCEGEILKSKIVFGNGELNCGMETMDDNCKSKPIEPSISKKGCCENHYLSLNVEDGFQPSIIQADVDVNFVFTFVYTFIELLNSDIEQEVAYGGSPPPLRNIDAQVLFQSFLI